MAGVERHQPLHRPRLGHPPEAGEGERLGEEVMAQARVAEAPLVLDRRVAEALEDRPGEEARALLVGARRLDVREDLGVPQAARRRPALEDEPLDRSHPGEEGLGEAGHRGGQLAAGGRLDHERSAAHPDEAHRVARHPEADLDLRADRHQLGVALEPTDEGGADRRPVVAAGGELQAAADHDPGRRETWPSDPLRIPSIPFPPPGGEGDAPTRAARRRGSPHSLGDGGGSSCGAGSFFAGSAGSV